MYRFQDFRVSPTLDLYLSPCKPPRNNPTKPVDHWVLILAPPNHSDCTFYHVRKVQDEARCKYTKGPVCKNRPLHSQPISTGIASLHKIGIVDKSKYDDVLRIADTALESASEEQWPWTMSFLLDLEERGVLPVGTSSYYDRFCEPILLELEDLMKNLEIDEKRESIEVLMRQLGLGR
ncbi:hypothetical protein BJX76DRAFT_362475 [Aspergillus varians]